MSLFSGLQGVGGELGVFVGRQSLTVALSDLCRVVSSVGALVSMLFMWLISLLMFIFASSVSCWVGGVAV